MSDPSDALLEHQFDLYARYRALADILGAALADRSDRRVLDVGAGPQHLTESFLPPGFATVVRTDVDSYGDPGLVAVPPGTPLPFADGAFDAVVAMDVLEHVRPAERDDFLRECLRVASRVVVMAAPIGCPEVVAAEREFGQAFGQLFRHGERFLEEHAALGLPLPEATANTFTAAGASVLTVDNVRLADWLALNVSNLYLSTVNDGDKVRRFVNRRQNLALAPAYRDAQHYRRFYVATRDPALAAALAERFDPARLPAEDGQPAAPLLVLAQLFRDYAAEYDAPFIDEVKAAIVAKDAHIDGLQARLTAATRSAEVNTEMVRMLLAQKNSLIAGQAQAVRLVKLLRRPWRIRGWLREGRGKGKGAA